jgi:LPXTG-site transpeptidase (sortase) family protein
MTAISDRAQRDAGVNTDSPTGQPARPVPPVRRRVAVISLLVLGVALLMTVFFNVIVEGPFERSWYRLRQRSLFSDFSGFHTHVGAGHAVAIFQIPKLGVSEAVVEGVTTARLRGGPAHSMSTPLPNQRGNAVIVGHRHAWGGPFGKLVKLKPGDLLAVETYDVNDVLQTGVYTVTSTTSAESSATWPYQPARDHRLTLITGDGGLSTRLLVVTAVSGKPLGGSARSRVQTSIASGSATRDAAILLLFGVVGGLLVWFAVRKRYRRSTAFMATIPFAIATFIGLVLAADLALPPLR